MRPIPGDSVCSSKWPGGSARATPTSRPLGGAVLGADPPGDARPARSTRATGSLRADVDIEQLAGYLELVWEGLIAHLAAGLPTDQLDGVLDVVEGAVRLR